MTELSNWTSFTLILKNLMKGELFTFQNAANVGFWRNVLYNVSKERNEKHSKIFEIFLDIWAGQPLSKIQRKVWFSNILQVKIN